jgi:hypothetical protein
MTGKIIVLYNLIYSWSAYWNYGYGLSLICMFCADMAIMCCPGACLLLVMSVENNARFLGARSRFWRYTIGHVMGVIDPKLLMRSWLFFCSTYPLFSFLVHCTQLLFCVPVDYTPLVLIYFLCRGCWFLCSGGRLSASM